VYLSVSVTDPTPKAIHQAPVKVRAQVEEQV
jgi:hypothetical protein